MLDDHSHGNTRLLSVFCVSLCHESRRAGLGAGAYLSRLWRAEKRQEVRRVPATCSRATHTLARQMQVRCPDTEAWNLNTP